MPNMGVTKDGGSRSEFQGARILPDGAVCRAKAAGFGDYVDCLVEGPSSSPHALGFGRNHLCLHPRRGEIAARTQAGRVRFAAPVAGVGSPNSGAAL